MMNRWSRLALSIWFVLGLGLSACSDQPTSPETGGGSGELAPLYAAASPDKAVPGQYIVVFKEGTADAPGLARRLVTQAGGDLRHTYTRALRGFSARLAPQAVEALRRNPNVAFIEEDQEVSLTATQTNATWGLDRIDQRDRPLNGTYVYNLTGAGVHAYIIDTGIRTSHNDFSGRATAVFDAFGGNGQDCNGHGTHVAGTVGGETWGVAKDVYLHAVRVLNCQGNGTTSGVIAGVDWVTANHIKPAVANMSLGGGISTALDNAVRNSIAAGVTYVVAAGNEGVNACNGSPSRVAEALTVGSSTSSDTRSSFSNYGSCLDLFAPGSSITSAWYTSNTATNTISGTSMAAPHVAGVAALYLQANPNAAPAQVSAAIVNNASTGKLTGIGSGSPNRLLYSGFLGGGGGNPDPGQPGAPCSGCETYNGSLSGSGDYDYQPNGNYYSAPAGTHRGWLSGPSGTDFDLYLYRWNGASWSLVAQSISSGSTEQITYTGSAGYYLWVVESYSGSGSYTFWLDRP